MLKILQPNIPKNTYKIAFAARNSAKPIQDISANLEGLKRKFWDILQGFKNTLPVCFKQPQIPKTKLFLSDLSDFRNNPKSQNSPIFV